MPARNVQVGLGSTFCFHVYKNLENSYAEDQVIDSDRDQFHHSASNSQYENLTQSYLFENQINLPIISNFTAGK